MRKLHGFTLIELLIVVAIIAILAAIAVPNFLEAQVRSKVSRVRSDHRSLATAIEAYYVDNNSYPAASINEKASLPSADVGVLGTLTAGGTVSPAGKTFGLRNSDVNNLSTLTTPISYITSYFPDPFADTRGLTFRYHMDRAGWILGSFGPDTDQGVGGDMDWDEMSTSTPNDNPATPGTRSTGETGTVETYYTSRLAMPDFFLLTGTGVDGNAFTYDPTNGTVSQGDVWRTKE